MHWSEIDASVSAFDCPGGFTLTGTDYTVFQLRAHAGCWRTARHVDGAAVAQVATGSGRARTLWSRSSATFFLRNVESEAMARMATQRLLARRRGNPTFALGRASSPGIASVMAVSSPPSDQSDTLIERDDRLS